MRGATSLVARLVLLAVGAAGCGSGGHARAAGPPAPPAPPEGVDVTLFLIGDAGAPAPDSEPVLVALRREAAAAPRPLVVFLGDNVYPDGLPDRTSPDHPEAVRRLEAQLEAVRASGARGVFIPGNHDWDEDAGGWEAVRRQTEHIRLHGGEWAVALPGDGCPGPVVLDLGSTVRLVLLDTQWWLHHGVRPVDPFSSCPTDSEAEILDSLRAALRTAGARQVVVAAHHPLESGGPHGGYFRWEEHVFPLREKKKWLWVPLPILGSAYPLARQSGITDQDVSGDRYQQLRAALDTVLNARPPLVYASGHDHNLQVLAGSSARYYLVSGTGTYGHVARVRWLDSTRFAASRSGYMRLEFLRDGQARLGVTVVGPDGGAEEAYSIWLHHPATAR